MLLHHVFATFFRSSCARAYCRDDRRHNVAPFVGLSHDVNMNVNIRLRL